MPAAPAVAATPSADQVQLAIEFTLDGRAVEVHEEASSLLDALREELGVRSVKDGCSPQGQCGCCTVLIDGAARVACVTPVRRVSGRSVLTVEGLGQLGATCQSFLRHGASQCGFCTPGILCRIAGLGNEPSRHDIETSLLAHLCRCTGWRSIVDAALEPVAIPEPVAVPEPVVDPPGRESPVLASAAEESVRARLEGRVAQRSGVAVVAGRGGFSDDTAPAGCLVAVPDGRGGWALGESLTAARTAAGKIQGRRSGRDLGYPLEVPPGDWDLTLQTTWVEPGYLEPDSSWCVPGGEPVGPSANGGAFGGKTLSIAPIVAKSLADEHLRPVRVVFSREDVVRLGPKRPPMAAGLRLDGSGAVRVVSAEGIAERIRLASPNLMVEEVEVNGPPVSAAIRAAGWAEAAVLNAACRAVAEGSRRATVIGPEGGQATAEVDLDGVGWPEAVRLSVSCGDPLDEVVLRSYLLGAAHMALGWVCSEGIAVDPDGAPEDLTIRSFGIIRARDMPPVSLQVDPGGAIEPVNGSDAAFAAVAAAVWLAQGLPPRWPTRRGTRT